MKPAKEHVNETLNCEETETCEEKEKQGNGKKEWKEPTLEDVSERVMAQPYIRFT